MEDISDEGLAAIAEIQRLFDAPLADLVSTPEEQAQAEGLESLAVAAPTMSRLREVVAFVGEGRPATQTGNLKGADAVALARRLSSDEPVPDRVRSMEELPGAAHAFHWAVAAELLAWRGTKIVAGPVAHQLEDDPLFAWLKVATTLLEHGLLDGFRQGWRKSYVELIDANAPGLLAGMAATGGAVPLAVIEDFAWEQVAAACGYDPDDSTERRHVARLIRSMVAQLTDIGAIERRHDQVGLTALGTALAGIVALSIDDEPDDLDLVDTDAQSLLLVCLEEMEGAEATDHLLAWCQGRPGDEAAAELCAAMLDDDDPDVWGLGLEALGMVDRAAAEPAVRRLRSHPGLRPLADEWLSRHSSPG